MLGGADVLLWDEPLNYVDLYSREQIEASVLRDRPTLVFIEHDQTFIDRVATRVIRLGGA
jgi:lincosamide and streptogramin A transport system ATP-binding/permease protein